MKKMLILVLLLIGTALFGESLFQVKNTAGKTVLDVTSDGIIVISPPSDTLMVISNTKMEFTIDSASNKGLSRSMSVVSGSSTQKGTRTKVMEVTSKDTKMSQGSTGDHYTNFNPQNIFLGLNSGVNTVPNYVSNTWWGANNVFAGNGAGELNVSGRNNVFIGDNAAKNVVNGYLNVALGDGAAEYVTNSMMVGNVFLGAGSGAKIGGNYNVMIGEGSGGNYGTTFSSGARNTFIGSGSGRYSSGSYNTFIGNGAGSGGNMTTNCVTGDSNVFIGNYAGKNEFSGSNKLYIDNTSTSTPLIWGDFSTDILKFNAETTINKSSGRAKLNLNGTSGNNVVEFQKNGNFGGSIGYNTDSNYVFLYHSDNVIVRNGKLGVGMTKIPTQKLDVNGNARFRLIGSGASVGTVNRTADGTLTVASSDIRLKENITTLENGLSKINNLRGVNFTWKTDEKHEKKIGFIAQEVEKVLPELVFTNPTDGYKGINYAEITAVLTEAVKELNQKNKQLEDKNSRLEKEIAEIKEMLKKLNK